MTTIDFTETYVEIDKLIVQQSLSDHKCQNLHLLRLGALWGKMGDDPIAARKNKIKWHLENRYLKDLKCIDGMPTEFEWKIFPGITTLGLLEKIQSLVRDLQCEPGHFKDRIIFMSMYNDIAWREKGNKKDVNTLHRQLRIMLANSFEVVGLSLDLDHKRKGEEPAPTNRTDPGTKLQNK